MSIERDLGIAAGITSGFQKMEEQKSAAEKRADDRRAKQQEAEIRKQELGFKQQELTFKGQKQAMEMYKLNQDVMQMQLERKREKVQNAILTFQNEGDAKYLNNVITAMPIAFQGVSNYENIDMGAKEHQETLKKAGITQEVLDAAPGKFVMVRKNGKLQVADVHNMVLKTGVMGMLNKTKQEQITNEANNLKNLLNQAEVQTEQAKYQAMTEYRKSGGDMNKWDFDEGRPVDAAPSGSVTKSTIVKDIIDLEKKVREGTATEDDKAALATQKKYIASSSEAKEAFNMEVSDVYKNVNDDKGELDIAKVNAMDADSIIDYETSWMNSGRKETKLGEKLRGTDASLRHALILNKKVQALSEEELSKGLADQGIKLLASKLSDKDFNELDPKDQKRILDTISFNSEVGTFLAAYIKSISGTAVAAAEYKRLSANLLGGEFSNTQAMKASFNGFTTGIYTELETNVKANYQDTKAGLRIARNLDGYKRQLNEKPKPAKQEESSFAPEIGDTQVYQGKTYEFTGGNFRDKSNWKEVK